MTLPAIIVDTNVLVSAMTSSDGASRQVLRLLLTQQVRAFVSTALFSEYQDVLSRAEFLQRSKLSQAEINDLFNAFLLRTEMIELYFSWRPNLRDEADNHIYELAVAAGNAPVLTYNLRDFASAELRFPAVKFMTPASWLADFSKKD